MAKNDSVSPSLRILNWSFGLLFLVAALIQWNDPDPWRWSAIWGAASLVCFVSTQRQVHWSVPMLLIAICAVWIATLVPEVSQDFRIGELAKSMKAERPAIELSREILGLAIILFWMAIILVLRTRIPRANSTSGRDGS